jgi:hypothetical protein
MYEFYFEGRRPSKAQLQKHIKQALMRNEHEIELSWGENMIDLKKQRLINAWVGWGHIKTISGDSLACWMNENFVQRIDR